MWYIGPHASQPPSYLHSFRAVLGILVAPGGSQQLACCTADHLGVTCSLLSLSARLRFTGVWLPALGFLSLTTRFAKNQGLVQEQNCPMAGNLSPQGCVEEIRVVRLSLPSAVNPVTASPLTYGGGKRGQNVSCDLGALDGRRSKQVSDSLVLVLIYWERGRGKIQLLLRISVPLGPSDEAGPSCTSQPLAL